MIIGYVKKYEDGLDKIFQNLGDFAQDNPLGTFSVLFSTLGFYNCMYLTNGEYIILIWKRGEVLNT